MLALSRTSFSPSNQTLTITQRDILFDLLVLQFPDTLFLGEGIIH